MAKRATGVDEPAPVRKSVIWRPTQNKNTFEERSITAVELIRFRASSGREESGDERTMTWNAANNWELPARQMSFLTEDDWAGAIEADPDFQVVWESASEEQEPDGDGNGDQV